MVQQGSVAQPCEEVVTVGSCEHIRKSILRLEASPTVRDGQEMEVVIAQHRYSTVPQCLDKPQDLQRLRPTVHEIASKPELVACTIKMQPVEQGKQGGKTALHISYSINSHSCLSGPCACVHSGSRSLDCVSCLYLYCTPGGCLQSLSSRSTTDWTPLPVRRTPDDHPLATCLAGAALPRCLGAGQAWQDRLW